MSHTRITGFAALRCGEPQDMDNHRIVRPDGPSWTVVTPGSSRASYRSNQCSEAVARAQRIVRNGGGGVVQVLDDSGVVVRSLTVGSRTRGAADLRVR
jgi:hypothetical protein